MVRESRSDDIVIDSMIFCCGSLSAPVLPDFRIFR